MRRLIGVLVSLALVLGVGSAQALPDPSPQVPSGFPQWLYDRCEEMKVGIEQEGTVEARELTGELKGLDCNVVVGWVLTQPTLVNVLLQTYEQKVVQDEERLGEARQAAVLSLLACELGNLVYSLITHHSCGQSSNCQANATRNSFVIGTLCLGAWATPW